MLQGGGEGGNHFEKTGIDRRDPRQLIDYGTVGDLAAVKKGGGHIRSDS